MTESLLKPSEVQQKLHISKSTLYRLIRSGQLPAVRIGGSYRIRTSLLEEFLSKTTRTEQK